MTKRIWANLIVFAVLGVVMTVWALGNVIKFDALTKPFQINAEFESSPGLQPNFDVAYLGVAVGKIKSVHLGDHKVVAVLDIDRGASIPDNVVAAAGRKSAIGEPYVDLSLPAGVTGGPPMRAGAVIPVSRTSVAVSYSSLFAAANKAVQGLNAADLHTLTHELALGWNGRSQSLAQILDSSSQITSTFGQNTELLNSLVGQLTQISGTLATHSGELGTGLDNLTGFTDTLARNSANLVALRDQAPDLISRFNQLLQASMPANECILQSLSAALPVALSQQAMDSLRYESQTSPQLTRVLNEISPKVNGKSNLNIDFVITLQGPKPALEYRSPLPLPTVGSVPACPGISMPVAANGTTSTLSAQSVDAPLPSQTPAPPVALRNTSQRGPLSNPVNWLIYVPPLIALAILIKVMGGAIPLLRPRSLRKPGRRNRDRTTEGE